MYFKFWLFTACPKTQYIHFWMIEMTSKRKGLLYVCWHTDGCLLFYCSTADQQLNLLSQQIFHEESALHIYSL